MIESEEFLEIVESLLDEIPEEFYKELSGGVRVLDEPKINQHAINNDLITLGEYHHEAVLGSHIVIYYGSFERIYGNLSKENLKKQVRKTLRHEFRHHLERLSGIRDLELEDAIQIAEYLKK